MKDESFLGRWSRRKTEAKSGASPAPQPAVPSQEHASDPAAMPVPTDAAPAQPPALPELDSLTPESNFAPFMARGVDPSLKGRALKMLFGDPALYPMDGLDVYIDDYSKPDPLPEGWLEKLNSFAQLNGEPSPPQEALRPAGPGEAPPPAQAAATGTSAPESQAGEGGGVPPGGMDRGTI